MAYLSKWVDQVERQIQAAPEVVVVGPRAPGQRKVFAWGLVSAAAVLVWAASPSFSSHAPKPTAAVASVPSPAAMTRTKAPSLGQSLKLRPHTVALAPQAAPVAPALSPSSAVAVTPKTEMGGTSTTRIARQLLAEKGDLSRFMALAVTVESYAHTPYWDTAGLNVGMGYCITRRLQEQGPTRVRGDLISAGLASSDVVTLMGHDHHAQKKVNISEAQAVALLREIAPDYEARARAFVGAPTFNALPAHRQAALTWLAYNTGPNLDQFKRLRTAVQGNHPDQALTHLTPLYRNHSGAMVANQRAGAYLVAAYWSEPGLQAAVKNTHQFEALAAHTTAPVRLGKSAAPAASTRATLGHAVLGKVRAPVHAEHTTALPPSSRFRHR